MGASGLQSLNVMLRSAEQQHWRRGRSQGPQLDGQWGYWPSECLIQFPKSQPKILSATESAEKYRSVSFAERKSQFDVSRRIETESRRSSQVSPKNLRKCLDCVCHRRIDFCREAPNMSWNVHAAELTSSAAEHAPELQLIIARSSSKAYTGLHPYLGKYTRTRHRWWNHCFLLLSGCVFCTWQYWAEQVSAADWHDWKHNAIGSSLTHLLYVWIHIYIYLYYLVLQSDHLISQCEVTWACERSLGHSTEVTLKMQLDNNYYALYIHIIFLYIYIYIQYMYKRLQKTKFKWKVYIYIYK